MGPKYVRFIVGGACLALAALGAPSSAVASATLQLQIDEIAQRPPMNHAQLGVLAIESSSGRVLASLQADRQFIPASSLKLLLSAAALDTLGSSFRFDTQLYARGYMDGTNLDGDLILVGGGDPTLTSENMHEAAAAVASAGMSEVRGTLLADDTLFDGRRFGPDWAWDGIPFYYETPIQALAIDGGTLPVEIVPGGRAGDAIAAHVLEPSGGYSISSRAVIGSGPYDDPARCSRKLGTTQIVIVGRSPARSGPETLHCAVEDTAAFALWVLRDALAHVGVSVGSSAFGARPPNVPFDVIDDSPAPPPAAQRYNGARLVWSHQSAPLIEILHDMLVHSNNFVAEHILKMLAVQHLHQRGNFIGGASIEQRLATRIGIDKDDIDVQDGSGLSPADRVAPRGLVTILRWAARQPFGSAYVDALPITGTQGVDVNRLAGTGAVGRVRAKSGYMQHAIVLAGYADTLHHGRVIFAVMVGDATGDPGPFFDLEDEIVKDIVVLP